ncbi:MAG: 23S rRNA (uracil(1939)-C(5))-methyltransferase RlmD [Deltaproteobacteria bacterium]|nr:MAG: 23S rRNA (uracil(1939)-C(5))-methyltransferase RlmD [Deltaproteobacteria bacterium]
MSLSIKRGDIIELSIEKMAIGGFGIARVNRFVIFVKGAVAGDKVKARVYKKKKDYAEAKVLEVITPSINRVEAKCPYFNSCGGCQWQHIKYEAQLSYKHMLVEEAISQIGKLNNVPVLETLPSPEVFEYRNKMEFTFSNKPWVISKSEQSEKPPFALGLHIPGSFDRVIDIQNCLLQPDKGNKILDVVRQYVRKTQIPVYDMKNHTGFWRFLTLRNSKAFGDWMVNIITADEAQQVVGPLVDEMRKKIGGIKTVVNNISKKKAAVAIGDKEVVIFGEGYIEDKIGDFIFRISANSFFQTNSKGAERLYNKVKEYAELSGTEEILDLYSGTGTIPIFLSRQAKRIIGIEINKDAVKDARKNCEINGVDNCVFIVGDIKEIFSKMDPNIKPDVIIADPPRPGIHKDVLKGIIELGAERLVYVSCNPATLARDLSILSQAYEVKEIQPVDMFPHTHHIEVVAKCVKK